MFRSRFFLNGRLWVLFLFLGTSHVVIRRRLVETGQEMRGEREIKLDPQWFWSPLSNLRHRDWRGGSEGCQSSWICQPSLTLNRVWSNPASRPAKNRTERQKTSLNRTQKVNTAELHPPVNLSWLIDSRRERKPPRLFESKTQFRFSPAPCSPCAPGTPAQVFAGLPALVCCGWTVA